MVEGIIGTVIMILPLDILSIVLLIKSIKKRKKYSERANATVEEVKAKLVSSSSACEDTNIAFLFSGLLNSKELKCYPVFSYRLNGSKRTVKASGEKYPGGKYTYFVGEV